MHPYSDKAGRQPRVRLYPERPAAVARRAAADLLVAGWLVLCVRSAFWLHELLEKLASPGEQLERLAGGLAIDLDSAGRHISQVPLVGDEAAEPLARAAGTAQSVADAARAQQHWAHETAYLIPAVFAAVPLAYVVLLWLPRRMRWARRVATIAALRDNPQGRDLLALRALATQPVSALTALGPSIAAAWRAGDTQAVQALAALELTAAGLRPNNGA